MYAYMRGEREQGVYVLTRGGGLVFDYFIGQLGIYDWSGGSVLFVRFDSVVRNELEVVYCWSYERGDC